MSIITWTSQALGFLGGNTLNSAGMAANGVATAGNVAGDDEALVGLTYGVDAFVQPRGAKMADQEGSRLKGLGPRLWDAVGKAFGTTPPPEKDPEPEKPQMPPEEEAPTVQAKVVQEKVVHVKFTRLADQYEFEFEAVQGWDAWLIDDVARIFYRGGFVYLESMDRRSQTTINGEKIPAGLEIPLAEGDRVQIGDQEYLVSDGNTLAAIDNLELEAAMIPDILFICQTPLQADVEEEDVFLAQAPDGFHPFGIQKVNILQSGNEIFIADMREREEEEFENFQAMDSDGNLVCVILSNDPSRHPVLINGRTLTGIRKMEGGDQLLGHLQRGVVAFPRLLLEKMAAMPKWRQRVIAAQIAGAESGADLETALSRAADFGADPLIDKIAQVLAGYPESSVYSLPAEWGIRQKVLQLMEEEMRQRNREKKLPRGIQAKKREGIYHPLERELLVHLGAENLEMNIGEAASLEELVQVLRESDLDSLEGKSLQTVSKMLEEASVLGELDFASVPEACELRKRAKELFTENIAPLRNTIDRANSMGELTGALETSGLSTFGGESIHKLVKKLETIAARTGNGIQDIPRFGGLRQKVRDLMEHANLERAVELARKGGKVLPEEPRSREVILSMDAVEESLYAEVDARQEEKLYLVLGRGKPLALLTREDGLRDRAIIFMRLAIQRASVHFPQDMNVSSNPFSGERVDRDNFEAQYRLARMVLNHHAGRPLRGVPTQDEMEILLEFVRGKLGDFPLSFAYVEGQIVLRRAIDRLDPKAVAMLRDATPEQKALLLEAYFGDYRHRDIPSDARAFQVAALFGLSGLYREVGVTYSLENGAWRANVSLGDLGSVRREEGGENRFFILHTHPEEYLDDQGEVMGINPDGHAKGSGHEARTMLLSQIAKVDASSRNVLFSKQDVKLFVEDAGRYVRLHRASDSLPSTPLYDAGKGIYKNWVVHPFGGSEINVVMEGVTPKKVVILFARDRSKRMDDAYKNQKEKLLELIRGKLKLEAEIREISYEEFQRRLPF